MLNLRGACGSGGSEDESERRIGGQNVKETYEIFTKSKKKEKTQMKNKSDSEGKLDRILSMIEQMSQDIKLLREEQHECNQKISKLREENENVRKENEEIKAENENMRKEIQKLDKRVNYLEKVNKQNNVIVSGMRMNDQEQGSMKRTIEDLFKRELEVNVPVKYVTTLGQRICLVELENKEDKIRIMKNKSKLRKLTGKTIYIDNDYTLKEQQIQKNIRGRAVEERQKGSQVRVGYQKMVVDGIEWKWNEEKSDFEVSQKIVRPSKN